MAEIVMDHVTKRYPDGYEAVKEMNLEIDDGEFVPTFTEPGKPFMCLDMQPDKLPAKATFL